MRRVIFVLLALLLVAAPALAQDTDPTPPFGLTTADEVDPNANITWPPPVYVVRGDFDIRGTANLPNQVSYFIEFRPLNDDLTIDESVPWFPATLPSRQAVVNDILGTWSTEIAPDGVYLLRLTINVQGGQPVQVYSGPVRVENTPPPFATPDAPDAVATPIPIVTLPPAPTQPPVDNTPRVTAQIDANVRSGDSTLYPILGSLDAGENAPILGISNRGTGWYQIRLPDGRVGWISGSIVSVSGNTGSIPAVQPPPVPITPTPTFTPTPLATATPVSAINLVAGNVYLSQQPVCNEEFTVSIDIANLGSVPSNTTATLLVQDIRAADNTIQTTRTATIPVLNPGVTERIGVDIVVATWYGEEHRLVLTIDSQNVVPENNEGDNARTVSYTLEGGTCDPD